MFCICSLASLVAATASSATIITKNSTKILRIVVYCFCCGGIRQCGNIILFYFLPQFKNVTVDDVSEDNQCILVCSTLSEHKTAIKSKEP